MTGAVSTRGAPERDLSMGRRRRILSIAVPAAVLGVAAATRLLGLEHPGELVFDETYYVKDAASLLQLGYEGRWDDGANELWASGVPGNPNDLAAFVAHPPLGKWVIALGLLALGPENPAGWRLGTAIAGIVVVGLVMLIAHLLFGRLVLTGIAGGLTAIDGNAIVMSRIALLDGVLTMMVLIAVLFVILDRRDARRQLDAWVARRRGPGAARLTDWGPAMWARPWLLAAGIAFGLAVAVKWSALYLLAAFAVLTLVADALDRRRAGITLWASGTVLLQAPISFVIMIPTALAAHLITWWGWFATSGGYGRDRAITDDNRLPGILGSLPDALQNWWAYQVSVYGYHVGESSPHAYEAPAGGWPLLLRPTFMHYVDLGDGSAEAITGIPNPLIWWASVAAVLVILTGCGLSLARFGRGRRLCVGSPWSTAIILTGVAAGWLPWLLYPDRTIFFFYTIVITPFLILALTAVLGAALGEPDDPAPRRAAGIATVAILITACALLSIFFLPLWTAMPTPLEFIRLHYWLPTWI